MKAVRRSCSHSYAAAEQVFSSLLCALDSSAWVQACPHDSVELRLRPPGIDLWTTHKPMAAELALQFTLLGAGLQLPHILRACLGSLL